MKIPKRLQPLVDDGLVDEVIRPLMSGKEASVLVVWSGGEVRCAKVYKEAKHRSFRHRASYEEGRSVRNSRRARAMAKRTKFGKAELEDSWQNTEVETIYRLARAGVRVPKPHMFSDGVLIMELVVDAAGNAAPRLNDIQLSANLARTYHAFMLNQVVRMLCAGLIHGDLSEYNVLVGVDGPVVIDFPQAIDAAGNNSAKRMLLRDVNNLAAYFGRMAPELTRTQYGKEIWKLYERGELHPETELTGVIEEDKTPVNVDGVLGDIEDAREEHFRRFGRKIVDIAPSAKPPEPKPKPKPKPKRARSRRGKSGATGSNPRLDAKTTPGAPVKSTHSAVDEGAPPKKRRRRRRRKPASAGVAQRQADTPTAPATTQTAADGEPPKKRRRRRRRKRSDRTSPHAPGSQPASGAPPTR